MPELIVSQAQAGTRLDLILSQAADVSRARIQKFIKDQKVTVNGQTAKPHAPVKTGDVLFYPDAVLQSEPIIKQAPPALDILYEDRDLLVLNKPAGLIVHPAGPDRGEPTLADALVKHDPAIASVGDDPTRPGLVHRLDKDVSGVMVAAKTPAAFANLKQQFQNRTIQKEYLALLYGAVAADQGQIDLKIARSKTKGKMVARTQDQAGKEALTDFEVIERFKIMTLVKASPKTGRTHQLRVHFKAIDHPIVGDKLYAKRNMKNIKPLEMNRLFLHAAKLSLNLMDGSRQTFEVPLPAELKSILTTLPKL
ncbi:RluA family pseudouridine synthase [Patescibacteria group bacterium]|nr:RluA family pseudouridine synthase [Patescibacteria group bacterium]MBU1705521.1 RluA family pseudouridine synthase [Patescibacteria group bacterium]